MSTNPVESSQTTPQEIRSLRPNLEAMKPWIKRAVPVLLLGLLQSSDANASVTPNQLFSIPTPQPIVSEIYPKQPSSEVAIKTEVTPSPSPESAKEPSIYDKLTPPVLPWSDGQEKVRTVGMMIEEKMEGGRVNLKTYLKAYEWNESAKKWDLIEGSEHLLEQPQMTAEENAQFIEQANAQKAAIETLPAIYNGLNSPKEAPKAGEPQQVIVSKIVTYKDKDGRTVEVYPMIVYEWDPEIYGWRILNKTAIDVPQPLGSEK